MATLCTIIYNSNPTFRPHSVFMCSVWIWEQAAIISLYSINWLVFITETVCLLRGTDWIFIYNSTFCPHSVFMCSVPISEQTVIISLSVNSRKPADRHCNRSLIALSVELAIHYEPAVRQNPIISFHNQDEMSLSLLCGKNGMFRCSSG